MPDKDLENLKRELSAMITHLNWEAAPKTRKLSADSVHVWSISFQANSWRYQELLALLSSEEKERAARFHFEKDQIQFVTARSILRKILAGYLDVDPQAIAFEYARHGKPALSRSSELQFNLSHSGDLALYAITRNRGIGVDVEHLSWLPEMDAVARRFFHREEISSMERFSGAEKVREFYRIWTRGEALLKWCGEGMTEPEARRELTKQFRGQFTELLPAPDYPAALAVCGDALDLQTWQWVEDSTFAISQTHTVDFT